MVMATSFYAKVGVEVDKLAFQRVDKYFQRLESRFQSFAKATNAFRFEVKLHVNAVDTAKRLQRQANMAMKGVSIRITKWDIDSRDLANQISNALSRRGGQSRIRLNASLSQQSLQIMRQQVQTALSGMIISPRINTRNITPPRTPNHVPGTGGGVPGNPGWGTPNVGNLAMISRLGARAIPFLAGAWGLSAANSATQSVTLSDVASQGIFRNATMPNGDVRDVYEDSDRWMRNHAERVGIRLSDVMPSYQGFMAASMPTMGYEQSQGIFKAFSEFGTVRGASRESMQRALVAVQQMAGKGQIYSEELKGQLAESQGFGELTSVFASAWQQLKGGNLKGDAAYTALLKAMEGGEVKSAQILPLVGQLLNQKSSGAIDAASRTSAAEQNRAANASRNFAERFAQGGGDAGFATLWRSIASSTELASRHAQTLGLYFNIASEYVNLINIRAQQLSLFLSGDASEKNFFYRMFGDQSPENIMNIVSGIKDNIANIATIFQNLAADESVITFFRDIFNLATATLNTVVQSAGVITNLLAQNKEGAKNSASNAGASIINAAQAGGGAVNSATSFMPEWLKSTMADNLAMANPMVRLWRGLYQPAGNSAGANTPSIPLPTMQGIMGQGQQVPNVTVRNDVQLVVNNGQTVSEVMSELTANAVQQQYYNVQLRQALASNPNVPN